VERPTLDELGCPPLGKRNLDDVEVLRDDRVWEDLARFAGDLRPEVAVGEVSQGEQPDVRPLRDTGGLGGRLMHGLLCSLELFFRERRLGDEDLGPPCCFDDRLGRCRVAGDHDLAAGAWRTEHLIGAHDAAVRKGHRLPPL